MKSPFAGYPRTKDYVTNGELTYELTIHHHTPSSVRQFSVLTILSALFWFHAGLVAYPEMAPYIETLLHQVNYWVPYIICHYVTKLILGFLSKPTKIIRIDRYGIQIMRYGRYVTFDRSIEHSFSLIEHDKAKEEKIKHEYDIRVASQKGKVLKRKELYGNSYHIALIYMGHRNDLLTVYGHKDAQAIVARLTAIDRKFGDRLNTISKDNKPEDQWHDTSGDLSDLD